MTETLTGVVLDELQNPNNENPWLYLLEVWFNVSDGDGSCFRIASSIADVETFQEPMTGSNYTSIIYEAAAFEPPTLTKNSQGTLERIQIVISNVSQEILNQMHTFDFTNETVVIRLTNYNILGNPTTPTYFAKEERWKIQEYNVTNGKITLFVADASMFQKPFPSETFRRGRCRFAKYGFPNKFCAFAVPTGVSLPTPAPTVNGFTLTNSLLTTCDFGKFTTLGCAAHGAVEKYLGLPELHPMRFGGQPDIPKSKG